MPSQVRDQDLEQDQEHEHNTPHIDNSQAENCFRILLATDNHVGYNERDPVRGQDSIDTFREILEIARDRKVDFILLAGDLFHENRPSRACLHQMIALLREYSLGDKPIEMELLSDPMEGKTPGYSFPAINSEDPNLNVGIPVFSIHGNHDDPQGTGPEGALCALDILAAAGVVNYFGKVHLAASEEDPNDPNSAGITIKPVLLQKGETRLAMYGLGNVKDARLHYELRSNRVRMFMPEDDGQQPWFNMLLVHQNRVKHGPQNSVPEGMFDESIDLVVWGHEHDCRIEPEKVPERRYYITQPGSSVATSLAHGEAIPKKVGILEIQKGQFNIEPVLLKTVRPFKIGELCLEDEADDDANHLDLQKRDTITVFLKAQIELLINEAEREWQQAHPDSNEQMMLPLIRLRVDTTGAKDLTNGPRIGAEFKERIANPKDVIQYYKRKVLNSKKDKITADQPDFEDMDESLLDTNGSSDGPSRIRMSELVKKYLQAQSLEVLAEEELEDAVTRYVDKDDIDAIKDFVKDTLEGMTGGLKKNESNMDYDDAATFRKIIQEQKGKSMAESRQSMPIQKGKKKASQAAQSDDSMLEDDDFEQNQQDSEEDEPIQASKKQAPRRSAPVSKTTTRAKKGTQKDEPLFADEDGDALDSDVEDVQPTTKRKTAVKASTARTARGSRSKVTATTRQSQLNFSGPAATSQNTRRAATKTLGAIQISSEESD